VLDASKTLAVLDTFANCFERILGAEDGSDGDVLEQILFQEMEPENEMVRAVLALLGGSAAKKAKTA